MVDEDNWLDQIYNLQFTVPYGSTSSALAYISSTFFFLFFVLFFGGWGGGLGEGARVRLVIRTIKLVCRSVSCSGEQS